MWLYVLPDKYKEYTASGKQFLILLQSDLARKETAPKGKTPFETASFNLKHYPKCVSVPLINY